jgi:hypothetical protein
MTVCLHSLCVVLCVGSVLAEGWFPAQKVLPTLYGLRNSKSRQGPKNCRTTDRESRSDEMGRKWWLESRQERRECRLFQGDNKEFIRLDMENHEKFEFGSVSWIQGYNLAAISFGSERNFFCVLWALICFVVTNYWRHTDFMHVVDIYTSQKDHICVKESIWIS